MLTSSEVETHLLQALQRLDTESGLELAKCLSEPRLGQQCPRLYKWSVDAWLDEGRRRAGDAEAPPEPIPPAFDSWSDDEVAQSLVFAMILHRATVTPLMDEFATTLQEAVTAEAYCRLKGRAIAGTN